jgi:hypothetical protein
LQKLRGRSDEVLLALVRHRQRGVTESQRPADPKEERMSDDEGRVEDELQKLKDWEWEST